MDIGIWNPRVGFATAGGTETFLREMCSRLAKDNEITVYTGKSDKPTPEELSECKIVEMPLVAKEDRPNRWITRTTPVLPAEIESITMWLSAKRQGVFSDMNHDVLSTHYYLDNLLVTRSVSMSTLFRFPGIKHPSIRWKIMLLLAQCDHYVSNSESTANRLREWFNINIGGTVYAGVDTDQFNSDHNQSDNDGESLTILFVGRLDEGKGLFELIQAIGTMSEYAELRIVGNGELKEDLIEYARQKGVFDRVEFVGAVPHDRVHEQYAQSDVFCLPSYHEGFPVVVVESLASGLPVVATNLDAIRETITDGESGLLIPPKDSEALADALDTIVSDSELRNNFAAKGPNIASEYDWDTQAREFLSQYKKAYRVAKEPEYQAPKRGH